MIYHKSIDATFAGTAHFSKKDAKRYREIFDFWVHLKDGFTTMFYSPPHTPSEQYHELDQTEGGNEFMRYQQMSVNDFVMENFESEQLRTARLCLSLALNNRPDQDGLGILFFFSQRRWCRADRKFIKTKQNDARFRRERWQMNPLMQ